MATTKSALTSLLTELCPQASRDVSLEDNLILLGGDSIVAAALAANIFRLWSVKVSVKTLLQLGNFAELLTCLPDQTVELAPSQNTVSPHEVYRQTDAQKMIYLETFRQPGTTAYNIPIIAELPAALSAAVLQNAIQKAAHSFPAIFTRFYDAEGEFLFHYCGEKPLPLIRYDSRQQAEQQFVQPFDLSKDCLLRAAIVPYDGQTTCIMLDFSHIIADGLSIGLFIRQLKSALYQLPHEESSTTIFDYSRLAETADYKQQYATEAAFWQRSLQTDTVRPQWPAIRQLAAPQGALGYAVQQAKINGVLATAIRQKAEQHRVTPFTLFLLGWYLLQSEVTDVWNSRVGLVVSGRTEPEYHDTFGMFVNTLLLPVSFSGETTLQHALTSLADQTSTALDHQRYPFAQQTQIVQKSLDPLPPLDALFAFQNINYQKIELLGGRFNSFHQAKKMAQFGMVIHLFDLSEQGYDVQWEYAPELFPANIVNAFLSHYQAIMNNIANGDIHDSLQDLISAVDKNAPSPANLNVAEFDFDM